MDFNEERSIVVKTSAKRLIVNQLVGAKNTHDYTCMSSDVTVTPARFISGCHWKS